MPSEITPDNIKLSHSSHPSNPFIANVLYRGGYLENWGSGVMRILDACKEDGVAEPQWTSDGKFVSVIFPRPLVKNKNKAPGEHQVDTTEKTTEKILNLIRQSPEITNEELAEKCDLTPDGVYYNTKKMREAGVLERVGGRKQGHWIIKGNPNTKQ